MRLSGRLIPNPKLSMRALRPPGDGLADHHLVYLLHSVFVCPHIEVCAKVAS